MYESEEKSVYDTPRIGVGTTAGRSMEIPRELSRQNVAIETLNKIVEELETRLKPVAPDQPEPEQDSEKESSPASELAQNLSSNNARIGYATNRIKKLIGRLEI